ncbi:toll-like receptor 4 isoform X2 [Nilaparvata lugens]|uniref:toll-like receptor 4 isoform X2 n=1 Tax=Nilaparvata lugens TaxID=108931 RepID=UPI00193D6675|nr:toll-like receptor 4 isoform X2 [Nilaparvata lugens]
MCNSHPLLNVIFVAFATPFFFVSCDNSFFDWVDEKGNILISYDTQRQWTFNPSAALLIALLEPKFLSTKYLESEYDFAEFEHLGKFEEVELRGRNLRNSSSVFDFLHSHNVKKLGLAKSELKDIPSELKQLESSLQYLSLASNDLSSIDSASIFPQVTALLELDLRFCQLKSLSSHFFDEVPSLRSVSLSGNYLLQSSQQNNLNFLKNNILYLDLNLNPFSHVISVKYTSSELRQFLNPKPEGVFLDLSYTYFKRCKSDSKYIQPNITHLSIIDSVNCFKNVKFTNLVRLEAIDASSNINAKKSSPIIGDEIDSFFKRITNVRVLLFRENHLQRGLVVKPNLFEKRFTSLEILDLSENNLRTIPLNLFQIHTLKNLNLSSNLIQKWDVTLVRNDSSAKHLIVDLSFNKIAWITPAMEHDFYNFKEINLRDNVLLCNEQLKRLLCAAERNYGSVKILNMKETTCNRLDRDESLTLEELKKRENCQRATTASLSSDTRMGPMVPIQSLWLLLTVLVCLLLYATWNWTNHVNFYTISKNLKFAASLTTFSKKKESFCCDYRYDVFVSYAGIDRDWVIDRLVPNLETESGIRICLHERDFQIGVGIMENIVDCIDKSQCLLLVISKSFVKSKWCQFEMNLGQYFTIESNKPHLILVLLEEIPKNVRPKVLSYLMRTRTYIEWPKSAQDNNEAEFFQRLTKALNDSRVS